MLAASVAGCGKPNPPLLPDGKAEALAALKSPYAALGSDAGASDVMVLLPAAALKARARKDAQRDAAIFWPAQSPSPPRFFAKFDRPAIVCPTAAPDGEVCTFTFIPTQTVAPLTALAPGVRLQIPPRELRQLAADDLIADERRTGVVTMRLDIDGGDTAYLRPPVDPRPRLAPQAPVSRIVYSDSDVAFGALGKRPVVCRADAPAGAAWERRDCTIAYGPNQVTVGRDAYLPGARAFRQAQDDPQLMGYLRDAAQFLAIVAGGDPVLLRALEPIRLGADPAAAAAIAMGFPASDENAPLRKQAALNAPLLPWRDVTSQREFEVLCVDAAHDRRPLLIYTADGVGKVESIIYDDAFKLFAPRATLVLVRMHPPAGDNLWAEGFADAIGAGQWSALTVTDKPHLSGGACKVGKVFQGPAAQARPVDVMRAVLTGRPPAPSTAQKMPVEKAAADR